MVLTKEHFLKITDLTFSYGILNKNVVFKDFNFSTDHDIVGLIGPNGAGKSTLVKILLGLLIPEKGKIEIFGKKINYTDKTYLQHIGVSFEIPVFPPWATILDYLIWVGRARGLKKEVAIEQAMYLITLFNLNKKRYHNANTLSAGLKKRYSLALAIIGAPDLLILDEPTANLDVETRINILNFLKHFSKENNIKILIMSHILTELEKICDEIAILYNGEIHYQSSILSLYKNEFIKYYELRGNINSIKKIIPKILSIPQVSIIENKKIIDNNMKNNDFFPNHEVPYSLKIKVEKEEAIEKIKKIIKNQTEDIALVPEKSLLEQKFIEITSKNAEQKYLG